MFTAFFFSLFAIKIIWNKKHFIQNECYWP
jgi:hypothetical protein